MYGQMFTIIPTVYNRAGPSRDLMTSLVYGRRADADGLTLWHPPLPYGYS